MWAELPISLLTPSLTAITMGWGMGAFNATLVWTRILRGRRKITVKQLNKVRCKVERMRERIETPNSAQGSGDHKGDVANSGSEHITSLA